MKGSEKSSASPKDEDDRSNLETSLNFQNPKKQTVKNFMSPTVSAVSKATFPGRKILAVKNESLGSNSSNTHLSKTPNLDSKPSPKAFPKASPKNFPNLDPRVTSKEHSSQKTRLSYNSRDETPSPRPQFLSYNPSRRKEVLLSLDNKLSVSVSSTAYFDSKKVAVDEAETVYSDNSSLSSSSSQEDEEFGDESGTLLEEEDEEYDIESDERAEKEVGWSLRGVLKYLLVLVVLVLTTSYISTMNSPTSARAFQDLTLGYQTIQNHSDVIAESVEVGYKLFFNGKKEQLDLWGLNQAIVDEGIEEEMEENARLELEDINAESVEMVEEVYKEGKSEDAYEEEFIISGEASDQFTDDVELQEKETVEKTEEVEKAEEVNENGETEDVIEDVLVKTERVSDQLVEDIELQEKEESGEQIEDVKENRESKDVIEEELVKTEVSDQIGDIELLRQQTAGETEGTNLQEAAFHTIDSSEIEKVVSKEEGEEIHNEASDGHTVQGKIIQFRNAISMANAVNPLKGLNQHMGTDKLLKVMFGFLTCAAIVLSLVVGSHIRRKRIASKHLTKPVVKEKPSFVLPDEREEHKMHVSSFSNTIPLFRSASADKETKETYQSRAPSVELLVEFEVGGGIGSSLMSSPIKSRMKDEMGNYSDFLEQGLGIKQDQQGFSEFSTMDSSSSERLTPRKKLLRKEFGNNDMAGIDGEGRNNMVATPLRRSARIRSRAVASP